MGAGRLKSKFAKNKKSSDNKKSVVEKVADKAKEAVSGKKENKKDK